jgi:phosphoglycolate phosphatase-like HAD superfamily hydrolase
MSLQKIFFDLDDTLINTRDTLFRRINALSNEFKPNTSPKMVYHILKYYPEKNDELNGYIRDSEEFWKKYRDISKKIQVSSISGTEDVLNKLSEDNDLGIITNNNLRIVFQRLDSSGIDLSLFSEGIHSCSENNCSKPSAKILDILGLSKENILYVGDDITDYWFAKNAGMNFYGVCTGSDDNHSFQNEGLNKNRIFPSIYEAFS